MTPMHFTVFVFAEPGQGESMSTSTAAIFSGLCQESQVFLSGELEDGIPKRCVVMLGLTTPDKILAVGDAWARHRPSRRLMIHFGFKPEHMVPVPDFDAIPLES